MVINLLIVLIILIVLCSSITYNNKNMCAKNITNIKYVRASRIPINNNNFIGLNTIKLKLDRDIPCGIYNLTNAYGQGVIYVDNENSKIGYMTMKDMNNIYKINLFDLWDLKRLESDDNQNADNQIIKVYNRGCCNKLNTQIQ
jgi:hypothetical protein